VIAAGGTAGHVLPALAVAEALSDRGVRVSFAGSPERVEGRLVPGAGFELDPFHVEGLPREASAKLLSAVVTDIRAPFAARAILRRRRPDVVLGGGSFTGGPMVFAAALLRIPAAVTETDAHLGLANRLAAPFARCVFLAYELPGRHGGKFRVTGRPIPTLSRPVARGEARALFGLPAAGPVVSVFGALAGARSVNEMALAAWGERGPAVLHIAGERDFESLRGRASRPGYVLLPSTTEFGAALSAADLSVSRAGGTVWELAAAGTPAVLVPYPHATGDHQALNARYFERGGGAIVVPDAEIARVPALVAELLASPERLAAMRAAMLRLARPDAAEKIAEELIALAAARR